jgi:hypothetical protein
MNGEHAGLTFLTAWGDRLTTAGRKAKPPEQDLNFTIAFHEAGIVQNVNEMTSR